MSDHSDHSDQADAAMRGKHASLYHHLCEYPGAEGQASFAGIEKILGFPLPHSAHDYPAWRANEKEGSHSRAARARGRLGDG